MLIRKLILSMACAVCISASAYQAPPAAYPLDSTIKSADHIFVGKLSSAKTVGDSIIYDVSISKNIWGSKQKPCLSSKLPYEIGSHYFFFVPKGTGKCMDGGSTLRRGLPLKIFASKQYVVLQDEKYIYPNFGDSILRVDSIPLGGTKPITVWSGVPIELFEGHVRSIKTKPQ